MHRLNWVTIVLIVLTGIFYFVLLSNRFSLGRDREEKIAKQEKQIEWYNQEIKELDKQIEAMSTDRDTLEKFARERFLFAEPGDDVYLIPDDTK